MPWNVRCTMNLKSEFVALASCEGANRRELCRRFGMSAKTGYKWLGRYAKAGTAGLEEHSRRPARSPARTALAMEDHVVALREKHPAWGGRKISARLAALGHADVPAPSTVTAILRRHGLLGAESLALPPHRWQRFEHAEPDALWQMDFKGDFALPRSRCYPLTVLDDHSRYNLVLGACSRPNTPSVQALLIEAFRRYGLPLRINTDNGPPFGTPSKLERGLTQLTLWLIRLGISISHSRPHHPQTNGKDERFHRSFKAEVHARQGFMSLPQAQLAFDDWRQIYNHERPHQALDMATPIERFRPSPRAFPDTLPPVHEAYSPHDLILRPDRYGLIKIGDYGITVPQLLCGHPIAARPYTTIDGRFDLFFCHHRFMRVCLRDRYATV